MTAILGGHCLVPYEQNMQQWPGFVLSIDPQASHS
jgi:hypothetical protein